MHSKKIRETSQARRSIIVGLGLVQDHEIIVSRSAVASLGGGRKSRDGLLARVFESVGMCRAEGWA
jgi:hypothetical protein